MAGLLKRRPASSDDRNSTTSKASMAYSLADVARLEAQVEDLKRQLANANAEQKDLHELVSSGLTSCHLFMNYATTTHCCPT